MEALDVMEPGYSPTNKKISFESSPDLYLYENSKSFSKHLEVNNEYLKPVCCQGNNKCVSIIESTQCSKKASNLAENKPFDNDSENIYGYHDYLQLKSDEENKYLTVLEGDTVDNIYLKIKSDEENKYLTILEGDDVHYINLQLKSDEENKNITVLQDTVHHIEGSNNIKTSLNSNVAPYANRTHNRKPSIKLCDKHASYITIFSTCCLAVIIIILVTVLKQEITRDIYEATTTTQPRPFLYTSIINASYEVNQTIQLSSANQRNNIYFLNNWIWRLTMRYIVIYNTSTLHVINTLQPLIKPTGFYKAMTHLVNGNILVIDQAALYEITPIGTWEDATWCNKKKILSGDFVNIKRFKNSIYLSKRSGQKWVVLLHKDSKFIVKEFKLRVDSSLVDFLVTNIGIYLVIGLKQLYLFNHTGHQVHKVSEFKSAVSLCGIDNAGNILLNDKFNKELHLYDTKKKIRIFAVNFRQVIDKYYSYLEDVIFDIDGINIWATGMFGESDNIADLIHFNRV